MPVINLLNLWMAFESLLWVSGATRQKNIFRIHNCTCIAIGYRMRPIINNSSTLFSTSFTCFARRAGVFTVAIRNQHLESLILVYYILVGVSSRSIRVAWARTSIHVQEYGTRHHHDIHLTPYYFLESMLEQSLQPRRFSSFSHRAAGEVGVCR